MQKGLRQLDFSSHTRVFTAYLLRDGHRNLNQQNAAPLDVGEEHLNGAVGKGQQKEQQLQHRLRRRSQCKYRAQNECGDSSNGGALCAGEDTGQITGEAVLQRYAELVQLHRENAYQRAGKETLQHIQGSALDAGSS